MNQPSHYQILGLNPSANLNDIKKAYRRLAKDCHPDRPGGGDLKRFHRLNQAYETLTDPQARAAYDAKLPQSAWGETIRSEPTPLGDMGSMPWEDDLWDILRDAGDAPAAELKPDAELEVSSQQAAQGARLSLELPLTEACPACGGTGRGTVGLCPQCRGRRAYTTVYELELDLVPETKDGDIISVPFEGSSRKLRILVRVQES